MGGGNPPTLPCWRQRPASWGPAAQEIPAASMSEGAGVALPSRDSGPQAGAAPWWAVSGTAVWASPVCLRPGVPHSDRTSPGGAPVQAGPLLVSLSPGGWRASTPAQETPRWAPARGPRRTPRAPSLGQGHWGHRQHPAFTGEQCLLSCPRYPVLGQAGGGQNQPPS